MVILSLHTQSLRSSSDSRYLQAAPRVTYHNRPVVFPFKFEFGNPSESYNLHKKAKPWRILVLVLIWRHFANVLLKSFLKWIDCNNHSIYTYGRWTDARQTLYLRPNYADIFGWHEGKKKEKKSICQVYCTCFCESSSDNLSLSFVFVSTSCNFWS